MEVINIIKHMVTHTHIVGFLVKYRWMYYLGHNLHSSIMSAYSPLTSISGSGIVRPLKNGLFVKISKCRGNRSPRLLC